MLSIHKLLGNLIPLIVIPFLSIALPVHQIIRWALLQFRSVENLKGKVVLITGAAIGIGEQIAYEYAKRGARLSLIDINEEQLHQVRRRALELGSPDVLSLMGNVSNPEDSESFIRRTIEHFGQLDHLVNNAGIAGSLGLFEDATDLSNFRNIMDVNFWGSVYSIHFALPHLRKSKGKIIGMASSIGHLPMPRSSVYNASKASVISLYETLRVEIGREVGFTIVTPGVIDTRLTRGAYLLNLGFLGMLPTMSAEECAEKIVEGSCRRDAYVRAPEWISSGLLIKAMFPELTCWLVRCFCLTNKDQKKMH